MSRWIAGILLAASGIANAQAQAAPDSPLIGTWRVVSASSQIEGEPAPHVSPSTGYIVFTPEHRIMAITVQPDRKPATNDAEALALAKTMMAYSGKFDLAPDHYTVHMEFSSTQRNLDQPQVRYYKIDGDKLSVQTAVHISPVGPQVRERTTLTLVREH